MANDPRHIAIILDGNRRYAKQRGLRAWEGHSFGIKKVEELLGWCTDAGIGELTLYTFSLDNFRRPEHEKKALFELFRKNIMRFDTDENLKKHHVRVRFAGRLSLFPDDVRESMHAVMERTKHHKDFVINFAMAYGGRAEIVDAVRSIVSKVQKREIGEAAIDEDLIASSLYVQSSPDILIRPGGEKRISDFLLWQLAYTEIFFVDTLWPEFSKDDFFSVIEEFRERERRFGT